MKCMLIMVDTTNNNNKFYEMELVGDTVHAWSGRVGETRISQGSKGGGEREYKKRRAAKIRKGYTESKVDLNVSEESTGVQSNVMDAAMSQITTDDVSKLLIAELVKQNIHNITSATKIQYDIKTGYFKTALGVITKDGVEEAKDLLDKIGELVKKPKFGDTPDFRKLNEQYFSIIPTRMATLRPFDNLLITEERISDQRDICEALIGSLDIISKEKDRIKKEAAGEKPEIEKIFEASVLTLEDKKEYKRLVDYFEKSKNATHGHGDYKVNNIYKISLGKEEEEYRNELSNQMELFHGTKVANLLSILKSGLLMPKYSPGSTTGYMFGQGLYFASQSTKSLNYCDGMYWARGKNTGKIYMFIADIAMGKYQVPSSSRSKKPDTGFDSYWAQPGKSGIRNDEMIVFNNNQIKLKYILEITK